MAENAIVYGLMDVGNQRRNNILTSNFSRATKPSIKKKPCSVTSSEEHALTQFQPASMNTMRTSFKDLCSEDKQRVANLIKELAKIGTEKEEITKTLEKEKEESQKQLTDMLQKIEDTLNDRDIISQHLFDCQNLLAEYKQKLECQQSQHKQTVALQTSFIESGYEQRNAVSEYADITDPNVNVRKSKNSNRTVVSDTHAKSLNTNKHRHMIPLTEPILSSTQKSMSVKSADGITEHDTNHRIMERLIATGEDKSKLSETCPSNTVSNRANIKPKHCVNFRDKEDATLDYINRNAPHNKMQFKFINKQFVDYYRTLHPSRRKLELLRQWAELETERQRLGEMLATQMKLSNKNAQKQLSQEYTAHDALLENDAPAVAVTKPTIEKQLYISKHPHVESLNETNNFPTSIVCEGNKSKSVDKFTLPNSKFEKLNHNTVPNEEHGKTPDDLSCNDSEISFGQSFNIIRDKDNQSGNYMSENHVTDWLKSVNASPILASSPDVAGSVDIDTERSSHEEKCHPLPEGDMNVKALNPFTSPDSNDDNELLDVLKRQCHHDDMFGVRSPKAPCSSPTSVAHQIKSEPLPHHSLVDLVDDLESTDGFMDKDINDDSEVIDSLIKMNYVINNDLPVSNRNCNTSCAPRNVLLCKKNKMFRNINNDNEEDILQDLFFIQ